MIKDICYVSITKQIIIIIIKQVSGKLLDVLFFSFLLVQNAIKQTTKNC